MRRNCQAALLKEFNLKAPVLFRLHLIHTTTCRIYLTQQELNENSTFVIKHFISVHALFYSIVLLKSISEAQVPPDASVPVLEFVGEQYNNVSTQELIWTIYPEKSDYRLIEGTAWLDHRLLTVS